MPSRRPATIVKRLRADGDTARLLDVDDAAAMVRTLVEDAVQEQPSAPVLRNIASQRPVSVCAVVRTVQQVAHRRVRVGLGTSPSSKYHVRDLRLCTLFPHEFRGVAITPFPVTVKRVYDDILQQQIAST